MAVPRSHLLAASSSVRLSDVGSETFITLAANHRFTDMCDGFCKRAGISARRTYEANSPATVANLIALGCGVGFWP